MKKSKTAMVTGASSGFGLLTSLELAKKGFDVIAAMRNLDKKTALMDAATAIQLEKQITVIRLDVTDPEQIDSMKKELSTWPSIDILINNAGFAMGGFCEETTVEEYREQFETNFFGVIAITQAVLPFMRAQGDGKIINVSSVSGQVAFPGLSPYVSSKHALEGYTECLRLEVKPFGIDVALIEPGSYQTNIWSSGKRIAKKSLEKSSPYSNYMQAIEREMEKGASNYGNPQEVADLIVSLCEKEKIERLRYPVGRGSRRILFLKKWVSWAKWEQVFFKRLSK
ncbi:MAG TPA: oxidoreductase [Chondromyces sp.]|nr:oxidoreductase [Chondromyces sp.]